MSQREPPRKGRVLRAVCQEASEDHLGVALIRSGDTVIVRMKPGICLCLLASGKYCETV